MQAHIFTDDEIRSSLRPEDALTWIREALALKAAGELMSPPRVSADLGDGRLAFTAGKGPRWYGYRAYDTLGLDAGQQVVVAHDSRDGHLAAIAIGNELGTARTGAIGGVAAQALTGGSVKNIGVIGTGSQAFAQLWAISGFSQPEGVRVFSRDAAKREKFADRVRHTLGWRVVPSASAHEAAAEADLVVLATNSPQPVIQTGWLRDDVVVTTLGPKQIGRAEFTPDLVTDAAFAVTDSLAQLDAYDPPALMAGAAMPELGDVIAGRITPPRSGRRVFCSVGLAGTEVHLLGALAAQVREA